MRLSKKSLRYVACGRKNTKTMKNTFTVPVFFCVDKTQAPGTASRDFVECFILMDAICPDKICWVWYAVEVSGRGGLIWDDVRVAVGKGLVRKQENKTRLYVSITGESTTACESII